MDHITNSLSKSQLVISESVDDSKVSEASTIPLPRNETIDPFDSYSEQWKYNVLRFAHKRSIKSIHTSIQSSYSKFHDN
jgi:hypothetical protein